MSRKKRGENEGAQYESEKLGNGLKAWWKAFQKSEVNAVKELFHCCIRCSNIFAMRKAEPRRFGNQRTFNG